MKTVTINGAEIKDENTFHHIFALTFGFPSYYGNNLNAWIDCMSDLEMTSFEVDSNELIIINIQNADKFKQQCEELWVAFLECLAFVNWRQMENSKPTFFVLSAYS
jgi:RNAse (barnase) inhibitor barstar